VGEPQDIARLRSEISALQGKCNFLERRLGELEFQHGIENRGKTIELEKDAARLRDLLRGNLSTSNARHFYRVLGRNQCQGDVRDDGCVTLSIICILELAERICAQIGNYPVV
jgi:hypothetical protein